MSTYMPKGLAMVKLEFEEWWNAWT